MSGWVAGATVVGSAIGSKGAKSAAKTAAGATDRATEEQRRQYDLTREDYAPWLRAGQNALAQYAGYGRSRVDPGQYIPQTDIPQFDASQLDLYADPSYQFRLDEQARGINRAAGGMGKLMSGGRLEELMARSGEMASQEYQGMYNRARDQYGLDVGREADIYGRGVDAYGRAYGQESDWLNRLAGTAQVGGQMTGQLGQVGQTSASNIGANIRAGGEARAAGQLGQSAAWQSALGDVASMYARYNQPQQLPAYNPAGGNYSAIPTTPKPWGF